MASSKYFELFIFVVAFYISWFSIVSCVGHSKDQHLSEWDDSKDLWKKLRPTEDPLEFIREWERRWKKFTLPPIPEIKTRDRFDYLYDKKDNSSGVLWVIGFVVVIIVGCVCGALKYYCEETAENSRTALYNELAANQSRQMSNSQSSLISTIYSNNVSDRPQTIVDFTNINANGITPSNAADPPPRYDTVVQDSLIGQGKFPEVQTFETPPPKYDDYNEMKY